MVQVNSHLILGNLAHTGIEALTLSIHQWNDSAFHNVLTVELAVNLESLFGQCHHLTLVINAISILLVNHEIESLASLQILDMLLKLRQCQTHP